MILILLGGTIGFLTSVFGTRWFIGLATRKGWGQFVREDGPTAHFTKKGTPQMGGIVFIVAAIFAYATAHALTQTGPTVSGMLVLFLMAGIGFVGFLDDWRKIHRERSLGLKSWEKLLGQAVVVVIFCLLATQFAKNGVTPASLKISFVRDTALDLAVFGTGVGIVLFIVCAYLIIAGASNGVNIADGLDGQAAGASIMVFSGYVLIGVWQANQSCRFSRSLSCYDVRDPQDLAVVAACVAGACLGFLWWNTPPARIFMGDTGSLALGAGLAGLAILTRTELLLLILGGLFVFVTATVMMQVTYFKITKRLNNGVGKRLFKMTPIHHHFELVGWSQVTISIRFWLICGTCVALGLATFYAEWVVGV